MKREKINVLNERDLLIGLITSDKFCREVAPILKPRQLESDYARILSGWIKDFYKNFQKAPKHDIIKLYRSHVEELTDEDLQDNILSFIEKLDKDFDNISFNDDFALQQSILYLKARELKNLAEDVDSYLLAGDVTKAEQSVIKFRTVEQNSGECVSILNDTDSLINSFTQEEDLLFKLPDAYGTVVGDIHREDFISFLAPMKRGKTWQLIDVAIEAMKAGLKVLHVSLEMSKEQVEKRYWTVLSGQVKEDTNDINYPYFVYDESTRKYNIEYKTISRKAVSIGEIQSKQKYLKRLFRKGDVRILAVPAYSLTVESLETKLDKLVQEDEYIPDVICIDYADIMSPSEKGEYRNQLDGIWKRLRGLAQKRKCVVFTASQSGRASIDKNVGATDIAEDIRKLAHVTSMVSLNQTPLEKQNGILRLKQLAIREGEAEFRQAVCTQCLSIGRIVMESHFEDEVNLPELKEEKSKRKGDN